MLSIYLPAISRLSFFIPTVIFIASGFLLLHSKIFLFRFTDPEKKTNKKKKNDCNNSNRCNEAHQYINFHLNIFLTFIRMGDPLIAFLAIALIKGNSFS